MAFSTLGSDKDLEEQMSLAHQYYSEKLYEEAFKIFEYAALQNHADALFMLGVLYSFGYATKKKQEKGTYYFQRAAKAGHTKAEFNLGVCYMNGLGVKKEAKTAVHYYQLAAKKGNAQAEYNLGFCYEHGNGITKDEKEAIRNYKSAANQGNPDAQYKMGLCYARGNLLPRDEKKAVKFYRLAAGQNYASAMYELGVCYEQGLGVGKDIKEAMRFYHLAAEQKNVNAESRLLRIYGNKKSEMKDEKKAEFFSRAVADKVQLKDEKIATFSEIKRDFKSVQQHPLVAPIYQNGFTCGIAAFCHLITHTYGEFAVPPARKEGNKEINSVCADAKKMKLTAYGEIFDVNAFKKLAHRYKVSGCKVINSKNDIKREEYIRLLRDSLKDYNLIVACDVETDFPSQNLGGKGAHWASVIDFFQPEDQPDKCYLLVSQYGKYYVWDADDLYDSNYQLPNKNPMRKGLYAYYKIKDDNGKKEYFVPCSEIPKGVVPRFALASNFKKFRYGIFGVPKIKPIHTSQSLATRFNNWVSSRKK